MVTETAKGFAEMAVSIRASRRLRVEGDQAAFGGVQCSSRRKLRRGQTIGRINRG